MLNDVLSHNMIIISNSLLFLSILYIYEKVYL